MRTWLTGFCCGVCLLGLVHQLPMPLPVLAIAAGVVGCLLLAGRLWFVGSLCLGLMWGAIHNDQALSQRIPACVAGLTLEVDVRIFDDPVPLLTDAGVQVGLRILGKVVDARDNGCVSLQGRRLRLSWHGAPAMSSGQNWRLSVAIKPPWGFQNPGGFDYERWLLGRRLAGTGYVKTGQRLAGENAFHTAHTADETKGARAILNARLENMGLENTGVLRALTMGDASGLSSRDWDLLRTTGTVHLMVISGLHVGLVGGLGFFFGRWLARLVPWMLLWTPATWWGAFFGVTLSFIYVIFTGSGLPAIRALIMVVAGSIAVCLGRRTHLSSVFLVALTVILIWEPLAVHQQGFWLSFIAVAALLRFFSHRVDRHGWTVTFGLAQWCLLIGLTPAVALIIGQVAWTGALVNLLVLPLVSFCVIPAALFGVLMTLISADVGGWGFLVADWFVGWVMSLLNWFSGYPLDNAGYIDPWQVICIGVCAWMALSGYPWRQFVALAMLWSCWAWPVGTAIENGEFRLMALDVGQGSAIIVDTKEHRLLFDAGPRYSSGFDLGAAVVVPSLAATGPERLDVIVVSHGDLDHAGGVGSVVGAYPVGNIYSSAQMPGAQACSAGMQWRWDGVDFHIHHPSVRFRELFGDFKDNDASCVLSISNMKHTVLLAGDISSAVERYLSRRLPVDVTLTSAPHHGSRSSSSTSFVHLLKPVHVFVSAGRFNRYGHPHPDVARQYQEIGAHVYVTGDSGALIWESAVPERVVSWRERSARYWTLSPAK
ncbi:MAG: DNA internalization-related competence protein ComEC/Rec2 [Gammaproteobacteria bacterium]|nr:DNA internalization-related competence protein ComEC/Rec2 [Gammaproteobacteria bacterium]